MNCLIEYPMRKWSGRLVITAPLLMVWSLSFGTAHTSPTGRPLVLEEAIAIPSVPVGPYSDHLAVDLVGRRLFATPQAAKAVAVLDLKDGRVLKMIHGIGNPHGILYSTALKRLFVVDGASAAIKVFSGVDYSLLKTIPLNPGADALAHEPRSRFIYVNNGGKDAGMDHAMVSVIDMVLMRKVADIAIPTSMLEGSTGDWKKDILFVVGESAVYVVDLRTRKVSTTWPLPSGHRSIAVALDAADARVYVACRNSSMHGSIIVLRRTTGQPIGTLPIGGWADGISLDRRRRRIYVSTGVGYVETYGIEADDRYVRLPRVESDVMAKTSLYSAQLDRLFVSVPHLGDFGTAKVLEFKPVP